ncbi:MAG: bifunctional oligoribonuclease/PAP phosphatase NrnA [Lentisphaerae bacterium]|nr:bifunctional oligoribonuclease/PAP phosphatase NrnA [Lentisphaerota bacterium]
MSAAAFAKRILAAHKVLIMTHLRPDGDALGSTFAMRGFLRSCGIEADVLLPGGMPNRYRALCTGELTAVAPEELEQFDLIISQDCANSERLGCGETLSLELLKKHDLINIDHHAKSSIGIAEAWVDDHAASTCTMVAEILLASGREIPPECATFLLAGMMTDTGCFCFANTDGRALRAAAAMTDRGADVEKVANALFFSKDLQQLQFEAELVTSCLKTACNGKFAYIFIPDELLLKYDFDLREDEGLIDIVRSVNGATVAMLSHRRPDGIRISLRSKDKNFPVGPIARKFGGGGHEMAAGCTLNVNSFDEALQFLLPEISALLNQSA